MPLRLVQTLGSSPPFLPPGAESSIATRPSTPATSMSGDMSWKRVLALLPSNPVGRRPDEVRPATHIRDCWPKSGDSAIGRADRRHRRFSFRGAPMHHAVRIRTVPQLTLPRWTPTLGRPTKG